LKDRLLHIEAHLCTAGGKAPYIPCHVSAIGRKMLLSHRGEGPCWGEKTWAKGLHQRGKLSNGLDPTKSIEFASVAFGRVTFGPLRRSLRLAKPERRKPCASTSRRVSTVRRPRAWASRTMARPAPLQHHTERQTWRSRSRPAGRRVPTSGPMLGPKVAIVSARSPILHLLQKGRLEEEIATGSASGSPGFGSFFQKMNTAIRAEWRHLLLVWVPRSNVSRAAWMGSRWVAAHRANPETGTISVLPRGVSAYSTRAGTVG
jgi:hypothetical protein